MRQYISPEGRWLDPEVSLDSELLTSLYSRMVENRVFDTKAIALQRNGKLGTYASSLGQEAIGTGVGAAMLESDVFIPSYREYAAQFQRGVTMCEILQYWGGDERGGNFQASKRDFPICVTIGAQPAHAVGVGYALKLDGKNQVAVCGLGDGATSKGDFYEAINAAALWKLPLVYVVANNQYAISTPLSSQTAVESLCKKAEAAAMKSEQVDGNDVVAVYLAMKEALGSAREGVPVLLEMVTYRMSDHTTADDASRYRDDGEVSKCWIKDPIARLKNYLVSAGIWNKEDEEDLLVQTKQQVALQVDGYLSLEKESVDEIFKNVFEIQSYDLRNQLAMLKGRTNG